MPVFYLEFSRAETCYNLSGEYFSNQHFKTFSKIYMIIENLIPANSYMCIFLSSYNFDLILYHTIPTFNGTEEEDFCKHCGIRRKCW